MSDNPMIIRELLRTIDPVELEGKIRAKHEKGLIDHLFMQWLDDCIVGKTACGIDVALLSVLRDEIRRLVWITPEMPQAVLQYYDAKIRDALESKPAIRIPALVAELKEKNLLTEEFCSVFHRALDSGVDERRISQLQANFDWEILLDSVGPEMASKIEF